MAYSKQKAETNAAHMAKLDRITLWPHKAEGERIRAAAAASGKSLQGFILDAVREKLPADPEAPEK